MDRQPFPMETPDDRRMKKVILNICGTCHKSGFRTGKRFDAAGWEIIVNYMINEASRLPKWLAEKIGCWMRRVNFRSLRLLMEF